MPVENENLDENQEEKNEQEEAEQSQEEKKPEENSEESEEQEEGSQEQSSVSEDTPVEVEIDGKKETITLGELRKGYMRQSDYTKKTQELKENVESSSPEEKKEAVTNAQEVVDNPQNFSSEDVETARTLLKIVKGSGLAKEFGLMTKEEFESEKAKEKQIAEVGKKFDSADSEVKKMKGMPAFNEGEIIEHMQATGIHDPLAAYLNKYDSQYRNYIIKQSKGDSSYKSDKGGKKPEPNKKEIDVRTDEGQTAFLSDELQKMKEK